VGREAFGIIPGKFVSLRPLKVDGRWDLSPVVRREEREREGGREGGSEGQW